MPSMWMEDIDPETNQKTKILAPISVRYDRIQNGFPASSNTPAIKEYRKKLFGHEVIDQTTIMYSELSIVKTFGVDYDYWKKISIHSRAKMMAQNIISNMVEVIRRHLELQDDAKKKRDSKDTKGKGKGK